ncbi:MAG: DUF1330 domain-containing protein [Flavobacteriales bacterium]|nr:DUF1330 domain-containing protein [Flavobacteriales bacterium]MBL4900556.1 DUF1330 domain-containing protein [Colwellia sp.]
MKSAYVIGNITVIDQDKWSEYCRKVPATLSPWEGELVFRGKQQTVLGGKYQHSNAVVIRFPSIEALNNWFNSNDYQALIPLREQAANVDLISYQSDS